MLVSIYMQRTWQLLDHAHHQHEMMNFGRTVFGSPEHLCLMDCLFGFLCDCCHHNEMSNGFFDDIARGSFDLGAPVCGRVLLLPSIVTQLRTGKLEIWPTLGEKKTFLVEIFDFLSLEFFDFLLLKF